MNKKTTAVILVVTLLIPLFSGCLEEETRVNHKPLVEITNPQKGETVSKIIEISGTATDSDGDVTLKRIDVKINNDWQEAEGITLWKFTWHTYDIEDGFYTVGVRAWDGADYSDIEEITIKVYNPEVVETDAHKWAVFVIASNFPDDNETKLGNGGLYLAEEMAEFFIENYGYPTSNIVILFDDGFIRSDNGLGERIQTLQERYHKYDITYAGATVENFKSTMEHMIADANNFDDSEIFIWISSHGCGDEENSLTGGKVLDRSGIYLWDDILDDKELGMIISNLNSKKTCVLVDACFSGGFADRIILDFPTFFLLKSGIPKSGRVVISSASQFRTAYASTVQGPLFTLLWFEGIKTGDADGFKGNIFERGKPSMLNLFKDGKVSAEEAFYYASYMLKNDDSLREYSKMEPQINDKYPESGEFRSRKDLVFGE